MMRLSEQLPERTANGGRRLFMVLMATLAVAVALSMVFAGDAEAKKKKKKKPRKSPNSHLVVNAPSCNLPPVYSGESVARAWGDNDYGKLGDATHSDRNVPVGVSNLSAVQTLAAGGNHSLALKQDCTVFAWGDNYHGQLGDGTTTERSTPVQVQNLGGVKAVAAGTEHSLALKNDGTVWAWGKNVNGQLGDGTTDDRNAPVQVQNLGGVKAMDAGEDHSVALKEDGTVFAWGGNFYGQLGDGTTTDRNRPVQVRSEEPPTNDSVSTSAFLPWDNLVGVTSIAAAEYHTVALKEDGTVRAWGSNSTGQLGNGTTTDRNRPGKVSNLSGVKAIDAGALHSVALKEDGKVWAWGDNFESQLGDGTDRGESTSPVQVSNLSDVKAIAAGEFHNLAKVSKPPVAQQ